MAARQISLSRRIPSDLAPGPDPLWAALRARRPPYARLVAGGSVEPKRKGRNEARGTLDWPGTDLLSGAETVVFKKISIPNDRVPPPRTPAGSLIASSSAVALRGAD